jgi:hypothetical protein
MARKIEFNDIYGEAISLEGLEPGTPVYSSAYAKLLNWVSAAFDRVELKAFTLEYLTRGDIPTTHLDLVEDWRFTTVGKVAWIRMQGNPVSDETIAFFDRHLKELRTFAEQKVQEKKSTELCVVRQRSPQEDAWRVANMLEDMIDANLLLGSEAGYDLLVRYKTRQGLLTALRQRFTEALEEYANARTLYAEYFEKVTDAEISNRIRCYTRILEDIESVQLNKRAQRKKIKIRASVERKVRDVHFRAADSELKITSVDPTSVLGAGMLITYNIKLHRIGIYVATNGDGLQIQGTTLKNFDAEKSYAKTLRKPEEQVAHFRRAVAQHRIKVLTDGIRGKTFPISGRINSDTLLLKVFPK